MDKLTLQAFEKLEKREHRIRALRNQLALGRITHAVYKEEAQKAEARYALTAEERLAYENHIRQSRKSK